MKQKHSFFDSPFWGFVSKRKFPLFKFTLLDFVGALGIYAALYGGLCLYMYMGKPLFVNEFGYGGHFVGMIPHWSIIRSDVRDDAGNRFVADFRQNILVIVQVPTALCPPWCVENTDIVKFILPDKDPPCIPDETSIAVEIAPDRLIRIHPDGNINSKPLAAGRAEELFKAVKESNLPDRMSLIEGE